MADAKDLVSTVPPTREETLRRLDQAITDGALNSDLLRAAADQIDSDYRLLVKLEEANRARKREIRRLNRGER